MSTIDDIATPVEVMMEQDDKKTLQASAPPATPLSPLSSLMVMTPAEASTTKRALPISNLPEFSPLASLVATNTDSPAGKSMQGIGMPSSTSGKTVQEVACPYFQSAQTLQTPNGQFFHYGDHHYP